MRWAGLVWRFLCALWEHVNNWERVVGVEQLDARLGLCRYCEHRDGDWCQLCGCFLPIKALWQEQQCPIDMW
jgi:hypothetical protein